MTEPDTLPTSRSFDPVGRQLFRLSIGVFFIGGFLTSVVSLLAPRLKLILGLGYTQALLVQFSFHSSYLLFALPIAVAIVRIGYMRAIATGLAVMVLGCLGFAFAQSAHHFLLVLGALLLLSLGITFLQIAANTVVTIVGASAKSAARLTLLQGFNALGTVLGPLLAAPFLLGGPALAGNNTNADANVALPFLMAAAVLTVLALAFIRRRNLLPRGDRSIVAAPALRHLPVVLKDRRLLAGTAAIFAYVGAEVTIGTLLTNYLMRPEILAVSPVTAGQMVSLYWGGAMLGRFAGALLLRRITPALLLASVAVGAALLTSIATVATGDAGALALLAVGLCNAVMYPTIYALALPTDETLAPMASMLLCMAVVGGAVVPLLTGVAADAVGLVPALTLPALCYVGIAAFAGSCLGPRGSRR